MPKTWPLQRLQTVAFFWHKKRLGASLKLTWLAGKSPVFSWREIHLLIHGWFSSQCHVSFWGCNDSIDFSSCFLDGMCNVEVSNTRILWHLQRWMQAGPLWKLSVGPGWHSSWALLPQKCFTSGGWRMMKFGWLPRQKMTQSNREKPLLTSTKTHLSFTEWSFLVCLWLKSCSLWFNW